MTVDVYRIDLALPSEDFERLRDGLTDDESMRARQLIVAEHSRRFVVARGALRVVLGQRLGLAPRAVRLAYGPHGKPFVEGNPVRFNLSHSHDLALLAVGNDSEIGVDVEHVRERQHLDGIAQRFFSPSEIERLRAVPAAQRLDAFYNIWTRKEAYLKARGLGIFLGLDTFDVSHDGEARLLACRSTGDAHRWSMCAIDVGERYRGALVVESRDSPTVQMHEFDADLTV